MSRQFLIYKKMNSFGFIKIIILLFQNKKMNQTYFYLTGKFLYKLLNINKKNILIIIEFVLLHSHHFFLLPRYQIFYIII